MSNPTENWREREFGSRGNMINNVFNQRVLQTPPQMPFFGSSMPSNGSVQLSHFSQPLTLPMEGLLFAPMIGGPFQFFSFPQPSQQFQTPMNGQHHFSHHPPLQQPMSNYPPQVQERAWQNQYNLYHQNFIPGQPVEQQYQPPMHHSNFPQHSMNQKGYQMNQAYSMQTNRVQEVPSLASEQSKINNSPSIHPDVNNGLQNINIGDRRKIRFQPALHYFFGPEDEVIVCDENGFQTPDSQKDGSTVVIVQHISLDATSSGDEMSDSGRHEGFLESPQKLEGMVVYENRKSVDNATIENKIETVIETSLTKIGEMFAQSLEMVNGMVEFNDTMMKFSKGGENGADSIVAKTVETNDMEIETEFVTEENYQLETI